MTFNDVLEIKNGKNQRSVENPDGRYPIYGSGGIMGYANDFICCANTVIIGRKGNINKPIYVTEPFWNVDTAFGLEAKTDVLIPKYLYYFCLRYDFERLNKAVTIPSLTKADLLKIEIDLPMIDIQTDVVDRLEKIEKIIDLRKQELQQLDDLIKARFVEMFGDPVTNPKGWRVIPWEGVFDTKTGKLDSNAAVEGGKYPFFTCAKDWLWIDKYAYDCEALLLAGNNAAGVYDVKHYKGKFNAYQRTYILQLKDVDWSYSMFKYQLEDRLQYLQSQSKGTNTRYLTMGILNSLAFIVPPKEMQDEFTAFVAQVDKSKFVVQKSLDEAQLLFDSLMQQYFG